MDIRQALGEAPDNPGTSTIQYLRVCVGEARRYLDSDGTMICEGLGRSLFGEKLKLIEDRGEFLLTHTCLDGYPSFVRRQDVSVDLIEPTHYICVPRAFARALPNEKTEEGLLLGMMSPVRVIDEHGKFFLLQDCGWVAKHQVRALGEWADDFVEVALMYRGDPYVFGGRIYPDCSLIIQNAFLATGKHAQRTAGEQMALIGEYVPISLKDRKRGDLIFWPAHVGVMIDGRSLFHVNGNASMATEEPLATVLERMRSELGERGEIRAIKRIPDYPF